MRVQPLVDVVSTKKGQTKNVDKLELGYSGLG
jgi:hypothetical protein